jgi:virginiamycin B lyase
MIRPVRRARPGMTWFATVMLLTTVVSAGDVFIRPRQEGRFAVTVGKTIQTEHRVVGSLGGREIIEIDSPARVSGMGKSMAVDNKGFVWVLETREDTAIRIDPLTLEMVEYHLPKGSGPYSISSDSKGTLWMTAFGVEMLLELHPEDGAVISHAPPSHGFMIHINADKRDDTVYFSQPGANLIVSYSARHGFREFKIPSEQSGPGRIDFDSHGNVWFPELYTDKVARLNPSTGEIQEWDLPTKEGLPSDVRVASDDAVWISLPMADKIVRFVDGKFREFVVPTKNSVASTMIDDAEGNLWFTEGGWRGSAGGNKLARLEVASGRVEEFALPNANAQPIAIIADRQGAFWFEESSAAKICRVSPAKRSSGSNAR